MRRIAAKLLHPALPALVVATLALTLPAVAAPQDETTGTANSVVAKAAQAEGSRGGDRRYPVEGAAMKAARAVATTHWGASPCGGTYELTWTRLDAGTNATASWRNPTHAWNNAGANFDCRIELNPRAEYDFPKLCTVLTHEIGHLLGQQHDPGDGQLMSAYYSTPLPACQTAAPAGTPPAAAKLASEDDLDGTDILAADRPRRVLRKKAGTRTKTVRRCVTRKTRSGKRVKRCRTVKVKVRGKAARRAATVKTKKRS